MASAIDTAALADQLPFIGTLGVLTPAQVQQMVSQVYAAADTKTQSEIRRIAADLSGRGFSASSPILAALSVGLAGMGMKASFAAATQTQLDAAKLNGNAVFNAQKAVSDQFLGHEAQLNDSQRIQVQRQVGVLGAIAQMVGGIV